MKEKKFSRIINHPRHIPGIFNFCDSWCERCPFNLRCSVYAVQAQMNAKATDHDRAMESLWPRLDSASRLAADILAAQSDHPGVSPVPDPLFKSRGTRADSHRLGAAAKRYMEFAHRFVKEHEPLLASPPAPAIHAVSIAEAYEVIAWNHMFITVKLSRALPEEDDDLDDDPDLADLPRDSDGSAKIALIGIDRSILAWAVFSLHMPAQRPTALSAMLTLNRLRKGIEKQFPKARAFVRPGFDTHQFPERAK